jgi:hypothetical protein
MLRLSEDASKYSFLLLALVAIPLVAEMPTILKVWLDNVPEYATMFCRLILVAALCDQISIGLTSANQAIGKIRTYNMIFYTVKLCVVIIGWICLKFNLPISSIMWTYVIIEFVTSLLRLPLMKHIANIDIVMFCKNVFMRICVPCLTLVMTCYLCVTMIEITWRIIVTFGMSLILGGVSIWVTALTKDEREYITQSIVKIIAQKK